MQQSQGRLKPHNSPTLSNTQEAERLICLNIRSFIADLCLTDRSFLITNILDGNHDAINDIVESSSEMFFKPGTLCYAYGSRLAERFNAPPAISMDMRFVRKAVFVSFLLHLEDDFIGVSLVDFQQRSSQQGMALSELSDAFYDARIYDRFAATARRADRRPLH
ncbi:hypothetical protein ACUSIJ_06550 [Pseudochelatococcus sp. B33]